MIIEEHPLQPFLPETGRILFLGSFPPPRERWSMEFFYPNWINDFWRIMGILFYGDAQWFVVSGEKRFDEARVKEFARVQGLAFFDVAGKVCRMRDNASDAHLQILEPADLGKLLAPMPLCRHIVTTGGKASEEVLARLQEASATTLSLPSIGECVTVETFGRSLQWWRMPSTSRAYPLPIAKKAEFYSILFRNIMPL